MVGEKLQERYCQYCGSERADMSSLWCGHCGARLRTKRGLNTLAAILAIFPVLFFVLGVVSAHFAFKAVVHTIGVYTERSVIERSVVIAMDCEFCDVACGGDCLHTDGSCGCWVTEDVIVDSDSAYAMALKAMYGITLRDDGGFLHLLDNSAARDSIDSTFAAFSPSYINRLSAFFESIGVRFALCIEEGELKLDKNGEFEFVLGRFDVSEDSPEAAITLYHYPELGMDGVNTATLAHELGHATHYVIRYLIGDIQLEKLISQYNAGFEYVGGSHIEEWDYIEHAPVFAYSYGMMNHSEDVATIFEKLVDSPEGMRARLSDPSNSALFKKVQEIRRLTYEYVSSETCAVFAPIYYAEQHIVR